MVNLREEAARLSPPGLGSGKQQGGTRITGANRPRSLIEASCGQCFRTTHKTAECRHQVVCLRCSCVGHMAAQCTSARSPHKRLLHVRSKKMSFTSPHSPPFSNSSVTTAQDMPTKVQQWPSRVSISLSLTPEIEKAREELAKVAVLSVVEGFVNDNSVLEIAPSIINMRMASPITPLNDNSFLVPLASRDEVKDVYKIGSFRVATKDGPCTLMLAPWSAEIGVTGRASGRGQWITIWNLPLHGRSWDIITEVVKPVGELIVLSHATSKHKRFLSTLVRLRPGRYRWRST
ncbi:Zinc finger CCHC-type protein [Dioscorea alata]|uniref:Zinc finger CCHC-type protein n=1 Tax=Dioscorea alata TaxID=55571 RepID=A0ACB7UC21_DIOAL|nr:Zinc finger CCHC-type protein [Dioscorea alata]